MHKNKPDWTKLITPEMAEVVAHIRQWNESLQFRQSGNASALLP